MASDDDLLKALGRLAREERAGPLGDSRWEQHAAGQLPDRERDELFASASSEASEDELRAAFAPLAEAEKEKLASMVAGEPRAAKVSPLRRRVVVACGAIAAAAALALMVPRGAPPLPAYEPSLEGGDVGKRGDAVPAPEAPKVSAKTQIDLVLRPARRVEGAVEARAYALRGDEARAIGQGLEASADGAFRLSGSGAELFGGMAPGPLELVVVVGRPGRLPATPAEIRAVSGGSGQGVQVLRRPLVLDGGR